MTLPPEVTRMIFEYADDEELAKLCMLSKNFNQKVCNSSFWVNKIMSRFGLSSEDIKRFKGNNTLWSYYNHLSRVETMLNIDIPLDVPVSMVAIEKIYHHPEYRSMVDILRSSYHEMPRWVNQAQLEEDMMYIFAGHLWNNNPWTRITAQWSTRAIGQGYPWIRYARLNPSEELFAYIQTVALPPK